MEQLPNQETELQTENTQVEQTQEQPQVFTGEMIANMSEEELEKHSSAIEAQFANMQSEEDYQKALQGQVSSTDTAAQTEVDPEQESKEQLESNEVKSSDSNVEISAEEFRAMLTAPFKASGREVSFSDPNDIIRLMQQGFDYQKKMAGLKPQKRIIKTLEQHGLLDESKVNQLIELSQGKPEAIAQYLKDHNIDTYNLPDVEETPHQYGNYVVSEQSVTFEEKVKDLQEASYGNEVLSFMSSLPDSDFAKITANQNIIDDLVFHAQSGLMNDALNQLEKDRALGRVPSDMSMLDAYNAISGYIYQNNQSKYNPNQPRIVGNNLQTETQEQKPNPKASASIPNNQVQTQTVTQELSEAELQQIIMNTPAEEIEKYSSWEAFVQAQSKVKFR